jgi:hypothetical protein
MLFVELVTGMLFVKLT